MKTIFGSTGLQYERQGNYILPKLAVENDHEYQIGIWGNDIVAI